MNSQSEDTHPDAEKVQLDLLRQASVSKRLMLAFSLSQTVIDLAKRGIRRRYPHEGEQEILLHFVSVHYGPSLPSFKTICAGGRGELDGDSSCLGTGD